MYAEATNNGAVRGDTTVLREMLRRFIEPILALRKVRRGLPGRLPGEEAPALAPADPGIALPVEEGAVVSARAREAGSRFYVEARRQWAERYEDYSLQVHHWRSVALVSGLVILLAASGMTYIGTRSKVAGYVVDVRTFETDGMVSEANRAGAIDPRILKAYLARFVVDWRSVTADRQVQKTAVDRVYAMLPTGSAALSKLNEHFKNYNPFALAASQSVNITINSVLPIEGSTWQVDWTEVRRDPAGAIQVKARLKASITVGVAPPTEENLMLVNPLGIYVTDLSWSQQLP